VKRCGYHHLADLLRADDPGEARDNVASDREVVMQTFAMALDFLFGCHHENLSRVFTLDGQTYRVCCDCGAKFEYSVVEMSVKRRLFIDQRRAPLG
jgi:hypothetical protein